VAEARTGPASIVTETDDINVSAVKKIRTDLIGLSSGCRYLYCNSKLGPGTDGIGTAKTWTKHSTHLVAGYELRQGLRLTLSCKTREVRSLGSQSQRGTSPNGTHFVFVVPTSGGNRRSGPCEFRLKAGLQTNNRDKVSAIGRQPTDRIQFDSVAPAGAAVCVIPGKKPGFLKKPGFWW